MARPVHPTAASMSRPIQQGMVGVARPIHPAAASISRPTHQTAASISRPIHPGLGGVTRPIHPTAASMSRPTHPTAASISRPIQPGLGGMTRPTHPATVSMSRAPYPTAASMSRPIQAGQMGVMVSRPTATVSVSRPTHPGLVGVTRPIHPAAGYVSQSIQPGLVAVTRPSPQENRSVSNPIQSGLVGVPRVTHPAAVPVSQPKQPGLVGVSTPRYDASISVPRHTQPGQIQGMGNNPGLVRVPTSTHPAALPVSHPKQPVLVGVSTSRYDASISIPRHTQPGQIQGVGNSPGLVGVIRPTHPAAVPVSQSIQPGLGGMSKPVHPTAASMRRPVQSGLVGVTRTAHPATVSVSQCIQHGLLGVSRPTQSAAGPISRPIQPAAVSMSRLIQAGMMGVARPTHPAAVAMSRRIQPGLGGVARPIHPAVAAAAMSRLLQPRLVGVNRPIHPAAISMSRLLQAARVGVTRPVHPATVNMSRLIQAGMVGMTRPVHPAVISMSRLIQARMAAGARPAYPAAVSVRRVIQPGLVGVTSPSYDATISVPRQTQPGHVRLIDPSPPVSEPELAGDKEPSPTVDVTVSGSTQPALEAGSTSPASISVSKSTQSGLAGVKKPNPSTDVSVSNPAEPESVQLHDNAKNPVTPKALNLKREINRLRVQVCRLKKEVKTPKTKAKKKSSSKGPSKERLIKQLGYYLKGKQLQFVSNQVRMSGKSKKGRRWQVKDKAMAMSIYNITPKGYDLLTSIFDWPSVSTLQRSLASINMNAGFNPVILETMGKQVENMSVMDRLCLIMFDEMATKENLIYNKSLDEIEGFEEFDPEDKTEYIANHAGVFIVKGITKKWKLPVAYNMSSGPVKADKLKEMVITCIKQVKGIGLIPILIICDQGSNNHAMYEKLGVTVEKPYFVVDGTTVYAYYDPPHLLKNVRNNFIKHNFEIGSKVVRFQFVHDLYDYTCNSDVKIAHHLSEVNIHPPPFATMNRRLAAQTLSHSVAAGIRTLCSEEVGHFNGPAQQEALDTADFIDNMDSLFNVFNAANLSDAHALRCAVKDGSAHWPFLEKCMEWLPKLKSLGDKDNQTMPCITGWMQNINVLKMLWHAISTEYGVEFLLTRRLNQDDAENHFSRIRGRGGHKYSPDNPQFRAAHRAVTVESISVLRESSLCEHGECEEDLDEVLLKLASLSDKNKSITNKGENVVLEVSIYDLVADVDATEVTGMEETMNELNGDVNELNVDADSEFHVELNRDEFIDQSPQCDQPLDAATDSVIILLADEAENDEDIDAEDDTTNSDMDVSNEDTKHGFPPPSVLDCLNLVTPPSTLPDVLVVVYIAGYIVKRYEERHRCNHCHEEMTATLQETVNCPEHILIHNRHYGHLEKGGLTIPSITVVEMVKQLESTFKIECKHVLHGKNVFANMMQKAWAGVQGITVTCGSKECEAYKRYMVRLYLRIRLFDFINQQNKILHQPKQRRNQKMVKLSHF